MSSGTPGEDNGAAAGAAAAAGADAGELTTTPSCPTEISDARHPQEIRMRTDKVRLDNPSLEATAQAIAEALQQGRLTRDEAESLSVWEAALAEGRACVAKLAALLETHDANRQPTLTAALTWAVLDAKLPEPTELRPGWLLPDEARVAAAPPSTPALPVPHLWALSRQPEDARRAAAKLWGAAHPRAGEHLVTDLGGFPVSHLVDYVVLGQRLRAGKHAAPYPSPAQTVMLPTRAALYPGPEAACGGALREEVKALIAKHAPTKELQMVFENARYVADQPREYLRWAVPGEVRAFLYPLILNGVFKTDPTRIEYVRIDDADVARIIEVQKRVAAEGAAGPEAKPADGAAGPESKPAGTRGEAGQDRLG
jgi:hypothetical protein